MVWTTEVYRNLPPSFITEFKPSLLDWIVGISQKNLVPMPHLSNGFQQLGRYDVRNRLEEASSRSQRHQCRHKQNNLCFGVSHIQFVWRDIDNSRGPSHGGGQIIGRKKPFLTLMVFTPLLSVSLFYSRNLPSICLCQSNHSLFKRVRTVFKTQ